MTGKSHQTLSQKPGLAVSVKGSRGYMAAKLKVGTSVNKGVFSRTRAVWGGGAGVVVVTVGL